MLYGKSPATLQIEAIVAIVSVGGEITARAGLLCRAPPGEISGNWRGKTISLAVFPLQLPGLLPSAHCQNKLSILDNITSYG
jgi:hypothetical protein